MSSIKAMPLSALMPAPVSTRSKTIDRTFYKIVLPIFQEEINVNPAIGEQQNSGY